MTSVSVLNFQLNFVVSPSEKMFVLYAVPDKFPKYIFFFLFSD